MVVLDQEIGVVIKDRVMALVTNRQKSIRFMSRLDHVFALFDRSGHQFFAENVLASLHRFNRNRGMKPKWQGDYDQLNFRILKGFAIIVVVFVLGPVNDLGYVRSGVLLVSQELFLATFDLGGANVAKPDVIDIISVVVTDHGLATFVTSADHHSLDSLNRLI